MSVLPSRISETDHRYFREGDPFHLIYWHIYRNFYLLCAIDLGLHSSALFACKLRLNQPPFIYICLHFCACLIGSIISCSFFHSCLKWAVWIISYRSGKSIKRVKTSIKYAVINNFVHVISHTDQTIEYFCLLYQCYTCTGPDEYLSMLFLRVFAHMSVLIVMHVIRVSKKEE